MNPEAIVRVMHVDPIRVVSIRLPVRDHEEAQSEIAKLRAEIGEQADGPTMCIVYGHTDDQRFDAELAVPFAGELRQRGLEERQLPADDFLHIVHVGRYTATDISPGIRETVGRLGAFAAEHRLLIGDNPTRYVYREDRQTHGDQADRYVTDVLVSYHLPIWVASLREGIEAHAGGEAADAVLADGERLAESFDADRVRQWVRGAVSRLDHVVPDDRARACIMNGCAHRHPKAQIERWKATYQEAGNLESFVERLIEDRDLYPPRTWRETGGPRNILYVERIIPPGSRERYDTATDPVEKRFHACFCAMIKDAIRQDETVSPTFCNCSGGWFVQIWEGVLGRTLRVDVVTSVLQGDDRCVFAIHLPEKLL